MKLFEFDFEEYDAKAVYDDNWSSFINKLKGLTGSEPIEEILEKVNINQKMYQKVLDVALGEWKESPSRSILHGISHLTPNEVPAAGSQIFPNIMWQTRFLLQCKNRMILSIIDLAPIYKNGKKVDIKGETALTVKRPEILNNVLRCLYLYRYLNSLKKIKTPKALYRGIRAHDIYNHDTFKPLIAAIWQSDKTHEMRRKEAIDIMVNYIISRGLNKIAESGRILAFTSSMPIAKYFANGEGIILKVDPKKVEIVTSEKHDAEYFDYEDYTSGKHEHEYIVRIPDDYKFSKEDIMIVDKDYYIAENNPLGVEFFDHDDIEAAYILNGMHITARWVWNSSGTNGKLIFNYETRAGFKKYEGFDPLPTVDNLSKIENFTIKKRRNY